MDTNPASSHFFGNVGPVGETDRARLGGEDQVLQLQANDSVAQLLEAVHVEGDVVVGAENVARAATVSVFDVGQNAVQGKKSEGAAVHFADAAEVAEMQAAARGLDDVGATEIHVKSLGETLVAGGYADLVQVFERTRRIVAEAVFLFLFALLFVGKPEDVFHPLAIGLDAIEQFSEGKVALASHEEVPELCVRAGGDIFGKQRGVITAEHGSNPAVELLGQIGEADRGVILKSHGRKAHDVGLEFAQDLQEARDRLLAPHHHVRHFDVVVIDLAGNGCHGDTGWFPLPARDPGRRGGALNQ